MVSLYDKIFIENSFGQEAKQKGWIGMKKMLTKRLFALLITLALLGALTACGGKEVPSDGADSNAEEQVKDGQTIYPCTVKSADGSDVTLEAEPEKIISVSPTLTEMLYALDAGDKLIGRSDYCDYPAEVFDVESMGTIQTPDMEKIISLDPDLVLVSDMIDGNFMEKLTSVGVNVLFVDEMGSMSDVYDIMTMMGMVLNKNEKAASCIEEMKNTIAEVEEKVKDLEAPSVYYVVGYGEYGDYTAGGDTFAGEILTLAGGDNISKNNHGWSITLEEIIEKDPYIIILPTYYEEDFVQAPHYCDLTAVKEGRVYAIDNNMVDRQGYRNGEAVRILAEIFHPEAFK